MPKIVFIGAGSLGFTRRLVRDTLKYPLLAGSEIALVDINRDRLAMITDAVQRIIDVGKFPAKIVASTTERKEVLKGADAVLCTILSGGVGVWQHDILIPKKYGIDVCVGDTRGPSGIFRALRTIPEMLAICRDIERYCPDALFLNYTNPMAMLCNAMQREFPHLKISGLCHSVQGTAGMLARWAGLDPKAVDYLCAGINHQSWYLEFTHKGRDLYPKLRRRILADRKLYTHDPVRNDMFLSLGYYVTESSAHSSEYNWWFRKRPDQIRKYCKAGGTGGISYGEYAACLKGYRQTARTWRKKFINLIAGTNDKWLSEGGDEYAAYILNSFAGGEIFKFNGNVLNTAGLVPNLPRECTVEVPVLATRRGLEPLHAGALPPQCAAVTFVNATVETMAVTAALTGDAETVYRAVCNDPLTAAVLSLSEIRKMTAEMLRRNRAYLPQFRKIDF